jgi:hypothetical protein
MQQSFSAITTMVRNLLNRKPLTPAYFKAKGLVLKIEDDDLYSIKSDNNNTELSQIFANGIIYRGADLICYKGMTIPELTLKEVQENPRITVGDTSAFIEPLVGKRIFMYWDPKKQDWAFADDKKTNSVYGKTIRDSIYDIMNVEYFYTYVFVIPEQNKERGFVLETMYDNKKGTECGWGFVIDRARRMNVGTVNFYYFEGFEKLEATDFPLRLQDASKNKYYITGLV